MSNETTKVPTPTPQPAKEASQLSWEAAKKKLADTRKFYEAFAGQKNMNPFFFIQKEIVPLEDALDSEDTSERTPELYNKIMALPLEEIFASTPKIKPKERSYSALGKKMAEALGEEDKKK